MVGWSDAEREKTFGFEDEVCATTLFNTTEIIQIVKSSVVDQDLVSPKKYPCCLRNFGLTLVDSTPNNSYFSGFVNKDVAFLHQPSKTLIEADLLMNLPCTEQVRHFYSAYSSCYSQADMFDVAVAS